MIAQVEYKGQLRTEAKHLRSGSVIVTDAPIDNQGKGEAFSPTDLVATALASCMITIMGIVAERDGNNIEGVTADVDKIMSKEFKHEIKVYYIPVLTTVNVTDSDSPSSIPHTRECKGKRGIGRLGIICVNVH